MRMLVAKPDGWPCTLAECPPGHMVSVALYQGDNRVWFKSEYFTSTGKIEAYEAYNEAGEYLCLGPDDLVQPIVFVWEETE